MHEKITCTLNSEQMKTEKGTLISELLTPAHKVETQCGGRGVCKKCRVMAFGELSVPAKAERDCFGPEDLAKGFRLACCARMEGDCRVVTLTAGKEQICAEGVMPEFAWSPVFQNYGAAIDIGTTTLALQLYDKTRLLAETAMPNPQSVFGADVISRMQASLEGKREELADGIRKALSELLRQGAEKAGIGVNEIDFLAVAGNTAMLYFLTGRDVSCLARAPFVADYLFGETVLAESLDLPCPEAKVYLAPCISAYVGGDITMALLSSGLCNTPETAMLADIGTNGEIALWHKGTLTTCSTAAGPAFEGASISCGMWGMSGAIDKVHMANGTLICHVIGEEEPRGICGSGLIDAAAGLLKMEELDETGYLENDPVTLAGNVKLTGQDIRNLQLAKAAIRAGMETLLAINDIGTDEMAHLDIAGGFGHYLNIENAKTIGLLPPVAKERIRVLGNAALAGTAMVLLQEGAMDETTRLAQMASTMELASNQIFTEYYMAEMFFEKKD